LLFSLNIVASGELITLRPVSTSASVIKSPSPTGKVEENKNSATSSNLNPMHDHKDSPPRDAMSF